MPFKTIPEGISNLREQADILCRAEKGSQYIPLFGRHFVSSKTVEDLETTIRDFASRENQKRVCVLHGDAGSGKSSFLQQFTLKLWTEYKTGEPIPLFISLPQLTDPVHSAVEETFLSYGFTRIDINNLKLDYSFIFIFDGYDEIHQLQNLYVSNHLHQWNAKTIISCRSQYFYNKNNPDIYFMPLSGEHPQPHLLQNLYVAPFNQDQVENYLSIIRVQRAIPSYAEMLEVPGLSDMITTPFLLRLAVEALPEILARYSRVSGSLAERQKLTQTALYQMFLSNWFLRQEAKLKASGHISEDSPDQKPVFMRYCQTLALEMHKYNLTWLNTHDERFEVFFESDAETEIIRSACPLKKIGERYAFWHQSFGTHLMAQTVYEEEVPLKVDSATASSSYLSSTLQERPTGTIHLRLISEDPRALRALADDIESDPRFKARMFEIVEHSKTNEHYAIGAANAISALNTARTNFSGMNLRGIQVPYANLGSSLMAFVDMSYSDLSNVNFHGSVLFGTKLAYTKLTNTRFVASNGFILNKNSIGKIACHPTQPDLVAYSIDVNYCKHTTDANYVYIARLSDGHTVHSFREHKNSITSLSWSLKGLLASGSSDKTIRVWDITKSSRDACIHMLQGHTDNINSLSWSLNGFLASGSSDKTIRVWDITKSSRDACIHILQGHADNINSLSWSLNGFLASGGYDKIIRVWDITNPSRDACVHILPGHTKKINSLSWSSSGLLASGGNDNTIRIWDITKGLSNACVQTLDMYSLGIKFSCSAWSPTGLFASGDHSGLVHVWDVTKPLSDACIQTFMHVSDISSISWSASGLLVSGSKDRTIRGWDLTAPSIDSHTQTSKGNIDRVSCVSWSPKGLLASGENDTIRIWDMTKPPSDSCVRVLNQELTQSLSWSSSGLLASGGYDKIIRVWDITNPSRDACVHILPGHTKKINSLSWSSSGLLASGGNDNTIRIWDIKKPSRDACIHILQGHVKTTLARDGIQSVSWSSAGLLASGGGDTVRVWNITPHLHDPCIHIFQAESVESVSWSPTGLLAAGGYGSWIWDITKPSSEACVQKLREIGCDERVASVCWSADNRWLISASSEVIVFWDPQNWHQTPHQIPLSMWNGNKDIISYNVQLHNSFLAFHDDGIHVLDLTDFPRKFDWLMSSSPKLWLNGCDITGAKDMSVTTLQIFEENNRITQDSSSQNAKTASIASNNLFSSYKSNKPDQILRRAAGQGKHEDLTLLLKQYPELINVADQNEQKGWTALHWAVSSQHILCITVLLQLDARYDISDRTSQKLTVVDICLQKNDLQMNSTLTQYIIKKYVKSNIQEAGKALRMAAGSGDLEGIKMLLKSGAIAGVDVNEVGPETGQTALHRAVSGGYIACASLLLQHHADPNHLDKHKKSPKILAKENKNVELQSLFERHSVTNKSAQTVAKVESTDDAKIKGNIAKLSNSNTQVRRNAALALWSLAFNHQDAIREARGIAPLIVLLNDFDAGVRQQAAATLQCLSGNTANQDAIREAQGIAPLIALLKDSDTEVREKAAGALLNLALNAINQDAIREAQGITPLVALLKDSSVEVRKLVTAALQCLALNAINQDAIREAQGILPLIVLLKDSDAEVKKIAAGALRWLAYKHPINQAMIIDCDAAPLLRALASTDENARNALEACQSLIGSRKTEQQKSNKIQPSPRTTNPLPLVLSGQGENRNDFFAEQRVNPVTAPQGAQETGGCCVLM